MTMPVRVQDPVHLGAARRRLLYGVGIGLWLSGAGWLVFHYFLRMQGEFGPEENPLTHWWLAAHGLFGFAALWVLGLLWGQHIVGAWRTGRRRLSGLVLCGLLAILIASGYLLYYAGGEKTRALAAIVHWAIGLALPLPYILHRILKSRARRR